jgi:hypothetical protein
MAHTHTFTEPRLAVAVIIELQHNGDPYGRGFTASESHDGGASWFFRGDAGARTRAWWRHEARQIGAVLREVGGRK